MAGQARDLQTTAESGNRAPSPPRLRRDAQRNRDAIVAAARQLFCDQGLEAPLDEIARRAGVGIATLYRRFPSRVELLDAVLADTLQAHIEVAEQALAMDDPWEGFAFYLEETCRLQASDRGQNDAMGIRFPRPPALEAARRHLYDLGGQLIARAQEAGQLRDDFTHEDLAFVTWANGRILPADRAAGLPTPGGATSASCWTASGPGRPPRSRSHRWHPGRWIGPCWSWAGAPPAAATNTSLDSGHHLPCRPPTARCPIQVASTTRTRKL